MQSLTFHKSVFFSITKCYIAATLLILLLASVFPLLTRQYEIVTICILFMVLPLSLALGIPNRRPAKFMLIPLAAALFLFNTFVLGGILPGGGETLGGYAVAASLLTGTVFTLAVHVWHPVTYRLFTITVTAAGMLVAYVIMYKFRNADFGWKYIPDNFLLFLLFHTSILLPLALGIAIGREGPKEAK